MEPCKIPEFWEIWICIDVPILLHNILELISNTLFACTIDYMYFFRILPVFCSFFWKKLEEILFSSFFHSRRKKPISSVSSQTLLCRSVLLWAFIFDYLKLIIRVPLKAQRINFFIRKYLFPLRPTHTRWISWPHDMKCHFDVMSSVAPFNLNHLSGSDQNRSANVPKAFQCWGLIGPVRSFLYLVDKFEQGFKFLNSFIWIVLTLLTLYSWVCFK